MISARAVLSIAVMLCGGCRSPVEEPRQPARPLNIVLITIDTLRADRVGRGLTTTLDALAARGVRFTQARTTAPLTLPAHASIMTGALPTVHGSRVNGLPVPRAQDTIASKLRRAGYRTGAVVGAFVLDRRFGLAHGFADYDDQIRRDPDAVDQLQAERRASNVVDAALAWLPVASEKPWFLWVHVYDPHAPYNAPGAQETNASLDAAYDREVAYADAEIGRLVSSMASRPDASNTAIIAAGDHGESLGEHGEITHGMLLFDPALRVPLIVAAPGGAAAVRNDPVSVIDILPTVLALAKQPADGSLPGRNLLAAPDADREHYAETEYPSAAGWRPARALVQDRWKLIASTRAKLFDLSSDAAEASDVSASRAPLVQAMQRRLDEISRPPQGGAAPAKTIDAETAARLRSLGYVAPATTTATTASGVDAADVIGDWASFEQALSAQSSGRAQDALPAFERLAKKHAGGALFQSTYARALTETGRARDALTIAKRAVERWPGDATLYHELAVTARAARDTKEAERAEAAALAVWPDFPMAHNGLGLLHVDAGRYEDAIRSFARAAELDPTNGSYSVHLGNAHRAAGQLDLATKAYRQALERDPTLADAANGLGSVLVQQRRSADAVPFFEQAVARDPDFAEAHLNLGIALQESGQGARALEQYKRVEQLKTAGPREKQAARTLRAQLQP
jgi:choline-sulfatase